MDYSQILLEYSGEITNIPQLDAKLNYYCKEPSMFLKFTKGILTALGGGIAGYGAYKTVAPKVISKHTGRDWYELADKASDWWNDRTITTTQTQNMTTDRIYSGLGTAIAGSLIGLTGYKILDHIIKKTSNKIVNSEDLTKEEKLKIINGMIDQTMELKNKSDDEDAAHCTAALRKLNDLKQKIIKTKMV